MMPDFISYFTFRTVFILASTTFSILVVMLVTNIITVDDLQSIFNLSPEAVNALELVISRVQEVTTNILEVLSQLLTKLFSWAGVDVDLTKIKVDVHKTPSAPVSVDPSGQ